MNSWREDSLFIESMLEDSNEKDSCELRVDKAVRQKTLSSRTRESIRFNLISGMVVFGVDHSSVRSNM